MTKKEKLLERKKFLEDAIQGIYMTDFWSNTTSDTLDKYERELKEIEKELA